MPILRTYLTRCLNCGWEGHVRFGDLRFGPWRRPDGTVFYPELICPQCEGQLPSPLPPEPGLLPAISPEHEKRIKDWKRLINSTKRK